MIATAQNTESPWIALDRFIQALHSGRQAPDQYQGALSAILEGTGASVAVVYSEQSGRVIELVGEAAPPAHWCCDVCQRIVGENPSGGVWTPSDQERQPISFNGSSLTSAALLRIEAPKRAWLAALGFEGDQPLDTTALRILKVVWRLQAGHTKHAGIFDNLKETLFGVVHCLSTAIDAKDPYTCGHSERVARIAVRIGEEMKLSRGEISDLYLAGLLHDVGKIGIRDEVLLKEGPLTPTEFEHIKEHPALGERIIANVTRLSYLRPGVRGHHERYDGKGYPDGLAGESIPLMARVLAVADSCDAMMSARRYRTALPRERIEEIVRQGAGTQWDPRVVDFFFACRADLYAVYQRGLGQSVLMAVERAVGGDAGGAELDSRDSSRSLR
jgi:HD-GYP domain-containing protein (c-di-GMP phosphodiesterase class II)